MLSKAEVISLCRGEHGNPFAVLGLHAGTKGRLWLRSLQPGADAVFVIDAESGQELIELTQRKIEGLGDASGFFEASILGRSEPFDYRLRIVWPGGVQEIEDPYCFSTVLGELDVWLLAEGSHLRPYERLGAHLREIDGVQGTAFAVWAPDAQRVSVVGDFNSWDGRRHPMRLRRECGVWELFLPNVGSGARYKYEIRSQDGHLLPQKADPYGFAAELRPSTASVVTELPQIASRSTVTAGNKMSAPISIYEVHLGSWRRAEGGGFPDWQRIAETLIPYVVDLGFTHLELLPISEHPYDGSWGYQPLGLYAPTARFGSPQGFCDFVSACHAANLEVIVDWVPAHFPTDAHGLGNFDGRPLYEHADPREGMHQDWGTLIYNFGRREVFNYLVGNALFWIEHYGVDSLRVDAVASMLYRDYSRSHGEWVPNIYGGRENIEAVHFLRRMNETIGQECPSAATFAEESTAWPAVTRPPSMGGLGFNYKWNMGWMHDVLSYMALEPIYRRYHHHQLTFGLLYAFTENFVLPLSHDEVVHGKGSLINKMSGDYWQKFANLRALYGFMWAHPGKKLLFMGGEFAQWNEWNDAISLDWNLLDFPQHDGVRRLIRDLNQLYRKTPALYELDFEPAGFEWISANDSDNSVIAFIRRGYDRSRAIMCVCNFTPVVRHNYRVGVPGPGLFRERMNTDSQHYGGSDVGNAYGIANAEEIPAHQHAWSVSLTIPPLATVYFEWEQ
ncbi:MAG: 1,4-alpha-glucan branching protein GlgB [Propionivibrio sp.]|nr:1,4-alpha-glucan branching protein GlgB [Propionivibrio sp.]MBK7563563.1 1,4-alpha-glucan branching protein GlgB [Propionivibrio sp.]MBK9028587.1 1,4-alpha-glucan branching protein GlgB [Propionivibrio sp.]MBP6421386.1 1,4-alpha-glucan branching protein GlgB [Propionivibrio sp.]HRC59373.1 1,4-alpha-glucan branching protein GlgB [Candidatus Propionivibrio aalborgensis]